MRHRGRFREVLSVCCVLRFLGQHNVRAQVRPSLGGQPILIEPTSVPGYRDCIKNVSSSHCVGGNSIRAQAPFDPSTACPTTPLYDGTGQLVSDDIIASQVSNIVPRDRLHSIEHATWNLNRYDKRSQITLWLQLQMRLFF